MGAVFASTVYRVCNKGCGIGCGNVLQSASIVEHMFDIEEFACSNGINIVESDKVRFGYFCRDTGTIVVPTGMPERLRRSMIAHELGHAVYGHTASTPKSERQADKYAARLLINEDDYRQAESTYGTDVETLAFILNVSPGLIEAWREYLARRGNPSSRS